MPRKLRTSPLELGSEMLNAFITLQKMRIAMLPNKNTSKEQMECIYAHKHNFEPVLCRKCGGHMVAHEEEVLGRLIEIAGYCPNEECDFYQVLMA